MYFILLKIAMRLSHYYTHFMGEEPRGLEAQGDFGDFAGGPVVKTLLPLQGMWVQSLVGELRSFMLHDAAKRTTPKQQQQQNTRKGSGFAKGIRLGSGRSSGQVGRGLSIFLPSSGAPPVTVQPATLARGPGRPASLYLARSKSISSSNPDLAVAPGSVDDEVSRILASKVGEGPLLAPASGFMAAVWMGERFQC